MAKQRPPEYIISDNPHGVMFFGPGGPKKADDGTEFRLAVASNSTCKYTSTGAKVEHIQGPYNITCGHNLKKEGQVVASKEAIAYSIVAENGDLIFTAPSGNIKFLAKNIFIETRGHNSKDGAFLLKSNGGIVIDSGEQLTLTGTKVCIKGAGEINLVTDHFINIVGDIQKGGSPLSSILKSAGIPSIFADLITGVTETCK